MNKFGNQLVDAVCHAIDLVCSHSHQKIPLGACLAFLKRLKQREESAEAAFSRDVFDEVFELVKNGDAKFAEYNIKKARDLETPLCAWYGLLVTEGEDFRLSRREQMGNKAAFGGVDLVRASSEAQMLDRMAHDHLLSYPECFHMLDVFGAAGKPRSNADRLEGTVCFARNLNATVKDYVLLELQFFGILAESPSNSLAVRRLPCAAVGYLVTEAYLLYSEARLDVQVRTEDVRTRLGFYLSGQVSILDGTWQRELCPAHPLFAFEVGATQMRLSREAFIWLTQAGLVDPRNVALVLRGMKENESLAKLGAKMRDVLKDQTPKEREAYLDSFEP